MSITMYAILEVAIKVHPSGVNDAVKRVEDYLEDMSEAVDGVAHVEIDTIRVEEQ